MKKTELIKNAINQAVEIVDCFGDTSRGWLVMGHNDPKGTYLLLPFDPTLVIWCYKPSHIKHIRFLFNGHRLW